MSMRLESRVGVLQYRDQLCALWTAADSDNLAAGIALLPTCYQCGLT